MTMRHLNQHLIQKRSSLKTHVMSWHVMTWHVIHATINWMKMDPHESFRECQGMKDFWGQATHILQSLFVMGWNSNTSLTICWRPLSDTPCHSVKKKFANKHILISAWNRSILCLELPLGIWWTFWHPTGIFLGILGFHSIKSSRTQICSCKNGDRSHKSVATCLDDRFWCVRWSTQGQSM